MNKMEWTPGRTRKMRKADQYRINPENGCLEVYQIDVPLELEDWEQEGLNKQREQRALRVAKSKIKKKSGNGESDERDSDLSD